MHPPIKVIFLVSSLVFCFEAKAAMVGSCLNKDKEDESIVTHCETSFEDEGYKIAFGADSDLLQTASELEKNCTSRSNILNEWEFGKECPTDNLVGVCHDKSGVWGGSITYYEAYLKSMRVSLDEIKDSCQSDGKIFTETTSVAEYEEAKKAIPSDLNSHTVLATCIVPGPKYPEVTKMCRQYHQFTTTKTLEDRQADCTGNPRSQWEMDKMKDHLWSLTNHACPDTNVFSACKSTVSTEYSYDNVSNWPPEQIEKWDLSSKVTCEDSGGRYFRLY